jgi:hypothetical protein
MHDMWSHTSHNYQPDTWLGQNYGPPRHTTLRNRLPLLLRSTACSETHGTILGTSSMQNGNNNSVYTLVLGPLVSELQFVLFVKDNDKSKAWTSPERCIYLQITDSNITDYCFVLNKLQKILKVLQDNLRPPTALFCSSTTPLAAISSSSIFKMAPCAFANRLSFKLATDRKRIVQEPKFIYIYIFCFCVHKTPIKW